MAARTLIYLEKSASSYLPRLLIVNFNSIIFTLCTGVDKCLYRVYTFERFLFLFTEFL
jgi:hypothetical protein